MEWPEPPSAVLNLFGVDMPDVALFVLGSLPLLVEPQDVWLVPQVVPDIFHRYLMVGQVLFGEL